MPNNRRCWAYNTYMSKIDKDVINNQIQTLKEENYTISNQYPEMSIIRYLQNNNDTENSMYLNMNFLGLDLSNVPQENWKDIKGYIIPILYVISSIISINMPEYVIILRFDIC